MKFFPLLIRTFFLPITAAVCIFLLNFLFMFAGTYELFASLDRVMHFAGGMAAGWIFLTAVPLLTGKKWPLLVVVLTVVVTLLWELGELLADTYFHAGLLGDTWDTFEDMVLGTFGSIVVVLVEWMQKSRQTRRL